jgi:hypothetical protein
MVKRVSKAPGGTQRVYDLQALGDALRSWAALYLAPRARFSLEDIRAAVVSFWREEEAGDVSLADHLAFARSAALLFQKAGQLFVRNIDVVEVRPIGIPRERLAIAFESSAFQLSIDLLAVAQQHKWLQRMPKGADTGWRAVERVTRRILRNLDKKKKLTRRDRVAVYVLTSGDDVVPGEWKKSEGITLLEAVDILVSRYHAAAMRLRRKSEGRT